MSPQRIITQKLLRKVSASKEKLQWNVIIFEYFWLLEYYYYVFNVEIDVEYTSSYPIAINSNGPVKNPSSMSRSVIERSNALDDKKSALDFWKQSRVKMKSASRTLSKLINISLTQLFCTQTSNFARFKKIRQFFH